MHAMREKFKILHVYMYTGLQMLLLDFPFMTRLMQRLDISWKTDNHWHSPYSLVGIVSAMSVTESDVGFIVTSPVRYHVFIIITFVKNHGVESASNDLVPK